MAPHLPPCIQRCICRRSHSCSGAMTSYIEDTKHIHWSLPEQTSAPDNLDRIDAILSPSAMKPCRPGTACKRLRRLLLDAPNKYLEDTAYMMCSFVRGCRSPLRTRHILCLKFLTHVYLVGTQCMRLPLSLAETLPMSNSCKLLIPPQQICQGCRSRMSRHFEHH